MLRVYVLYRVSTKKQVDKQKDDIPMQKIACREFVEEKGWVIVKEFYEKGVSGFKVSANDRDAIQELKEAALNKEFDVLLVYMFDRLGRIDSETPFVLEWFVNQGIQVWSTQEGQQKMDDHADKLMNYIRFWQANGESKKTSMSFKTAFGLSLNNLMTKKGRTILTAFAGSIGIIGIALIMSLSNGINEYIARIEEQTLSSYPLIIQKESIDMSSMIESLAGNSTTKEYDDGKIHSVNIMGDIFTTMTQEVKKNDLKSFKEYLESKSEFEELTSDIQYSYGVTMNIYKNDLDNITRVNPTTVFEEDESMEKKTGKKLVRKLNISNTNDN